ncbi:MAG TPA: CYTH domain-containing protein [Candidatus Limnocylindrales bacterium]|nr:CYTH domain-containing protein [Candidatus Limnocylindrales bacterium]
MPTEVEAKFRAETAEPLIELAGRPRLGRAILGSPRTVDEVDRYLDTDDGRLAAARWACRLRSREGVTRISLKGPPIGAVEGWRHRRPEVEGPATDAVDPDGWPASPALELLTRLRDGRPLLEHLRLYQARTERAVSLPDGTSIGTLTLDRVRMAANGTDLGRLFVVELELDASSESGEAELDGLAAELAATDGLVAEPRSKLEHALDLIAERR